MKNIKFKIIGLFAGVMICLSSCTTLFFGADPSTDQATSFDYFCETIETKYSLFDIKKTDWQATSAEYRKQLKDSLSDEEFLNLLNQLAGELKDGHTNIYGGFNYTRYWDWYLDYPGNFYFEIIERNYLRKNHWRTGPFLHTIIDSIGYIYYPSFSPPISGKNLKTVFERIKNCKGLIIDIRNNGGGKLENVKKLAAHLADTTRQTHLFYYKTGAGKDEFTEPISYSVKPAKNAFTKATVILINRKSYSAATFFPSALATFPHVTIMGDRSGGGGGIPYFHELPNGWLFRISSTITIDEKGRNIEPGIEPDIQVEFSRGDLSAGKDAFIDTALDFLKNKVSE